MARDGSGLLTREAVARVLPREPAPMREYLIELMRRFELAFPVDDDGSWLVPQCLSEEQPALDAEWLGSGATRLRYRYSVLPEGLVPRFITRTHPLSEAALRWATGVADFMHIHSQLEGLTVHEELERTPGVWLQVRTLEADERHHSDSSAATPQGSIRFPPSVELNRVSHPAARDAGAWRARVFISYSSRDARLKDELLIRSSPCRPPRD